MSNQVRPGLSSGYQSACDLQAKVSRASFATLLTLIQPSVIFHQQAQRFRLFRRGNYRDVKAKMGLDFGHYNPTKMTAKAYVHITGNSQGNMV